MVSHDLKSEDFSVNNEDSVMTSSAIHRGFDTCDEFVLSQIVRDSVTNGSVCFLRLNRDNDFVSGNSDFNSVDVFDFTNEFKNYFENYKKDSSLTDNVKAFNSLVTSLVTHKLTINDLYLDLIKMNNPNYNIMDEDKNSLLCFVSIGLASFAVKTFNMSLHKRAIRMLVKKFSDSFIENGENLFFVVDNGNILTEHDGPFTLVSVPFYKSETKKVDEMNVVENLDNDLVSGNSVFCDPVSDVLGRDVPKISNRGGVEVSGIKKRVSRSRSSGISQKENQKALERASQANRIKETLDASNKNVSDYKSRYFSCDPSKIVDVSISNRDSMMPPRKHLVENGSSIDNGDVFGNIYMRYTSSPFSVTQAVEIDLTSFFDKLYAFSNKDSCGNVEGNLANAFYMRDVLISIGNEGAINVLYPVIKEYLASVSFDFLSELRNLVESSGFVFDYKNTSFELSVNSSSLLSYCNNRFGGFGLESEVYSKIKSIISLHGDYI